MCVRVCVCVHMCMCLAHPAGVQSCRDMGIKCPILPGYMVAQTFSGFQKFTSWCRTSVPSGLRKALNDTRHDDEGVKRVGIQVCVCASEM